MLRYVVVLFIFVFKKIQKVPENLSIIKKTHFMRVDRFPKKYRSGFIPFAKSPTSGLFRRWSFFTSSSA
jgi:hypothetical protein